VNEQRGAGFVESELLLTNRLAGRAGLRTEYSALLGRWNAAPRLGLAYKTGAHSQLAAAWGWFYQTPTTDLLRVSPRLRFERAAHYLLTYQRLVQARTLRAEVYQKDYAQLTTYDGNQAFNPRTYQNAGRGYARGLDVLFRDRTTFKMADYWVSYGYLDTRRQFRADPVLAVPTFAARHNLSVVGKYYVQKLHTQFGFTYSYGSGRRYHNPNLPRLQPKHPAQLSGPEPERELPHPLVRAVHHRVRVGFQRAGAQQYLRLQLRPHRRCQRRVSPRCRCCRPLRACCSWAYYLDQQEDEGKFE
jgi:hypothetical protein